MFDSLSIVELDKTGPGNRVHGFPGGIGNEVKMKAGHINLVRIYPATV
jgi:hypothetical protein